MEPQPYREKTGSCLFLFQQLEELIQLRQDHDTGTAVGRAAFFGIIGRNGDVFGTTCGSDMCRIETVLFLQDPDHRCGTFNAEIPVVYQIRRTAIVLIIGMAFHHELDIRLGLQYGGHFAQNSFSRLRYIIASALEKELVGNIDINDPFIYFDIDVLVVHVADGAFKVHDQGHVQRVFMGEFILKILNITVFRANIVQRFFDAFCLRAGDDREILQLLEGGIVISASGNRLVY